MTAFSLSGVAAAGCGCSGICTIGSGAGSFAALRDGGVLDATGFGLTAAREGAPLTRLESCSASAGSRGTILKTASALIAVSTGAVTGGVSGALARLLNSKTPTVVTSAAGTS